MLAAFEGPSLFRGVHRYEIMIGVQAASSAAASSHRDLVRFFLLRWLEPCAISRYFIETLAEIERAMANRDEGFRRFNRQKLCDHVCRLAVGHHTTLARRRGFINSGVA